MERIDYYLRESFPEMVVNAIEGDGGFTEYLIPAVAGLSDAMIASIFAEIAAECTGADFDRLSGLTPPGEDHPAVVIANRVDEFGLG